MIIFRTNASSSIGIGHLARCRRLAVSLKADGYEVKFFLDYVTDYLNHFLQGFSCYGMYSEEKSFSGEKEDAKSFLQYCENKEVNAVIVDDYRFSIIWEKAIIKLECPVIVLDDQDKNRHQCNLLIDSSWEGDKTLQRYEGKVADYTTRLLGPKYLLIDEVFGNHTKLYRSTSQEDKKIRLLLSLGGGGNLSFLKSLIKQIINSSIDGVSYQLATVIGPYASNKEQLLEFSNRYAEVEIIINQDGLYEEISKADLYIGASGGTLFESLALRIPSLTFSISENQQNEYSNFEDLGHYFHLNELVEDNFSDFTKLLWEMVLQYDRVYKLYQKFTPFQIDGKGVKRVSKAIQSVIRNESILPLETISEEKKSDIKKSYQLSQIDDSAINRYLNAYNLKINLEKTIDTRPIKTLNHYLWWLRENRRTSYVLKKNGEELLFIWHQLQKVEQMSVVISGWHVCTERCSALDAIHAITEHSLIIDYLFPGISWIIVMRKNNRFMQEFNQRLGFVRVDKGSDIENVVKMCFPKTDSENFFYYVRRTEEPVLNERLRPKNS